MGLKKRYLRTIALLGALSLSSSMFPAWAQNSPDDLIIAQAFDPTSLWPNFNTASDEVNAGALITEPLFWTDATTNELKPILALGYEMEDDTTLTVSLREGVSFTNGEAFNADAVVASFNNFIDTQVTPAYARYAGVFDTIEKIDDHTVRITTKFAYPALELALGKIFIVPPAYWAEVGAEGFGRAPIGTGPFALSEWRRDDRVIMTRNPDYWGDTPTGVERVILRPVPDDIARAAGVEAGEFDIATNIPIANAAAIEAAGQTVLEVPSFRIFSLALSNLEQHPSPMHEKLVRQAVNYAIDKQGIIGGLFQGRAKPLHGQLLRDKQIGFNPDLRDYPYDPEKARALLAEAGYPDGLDIDFRFPSGRYVQDQEVATAIAGMLRAVGIRPNMIQLEAGEFLRQLVNRELAPIGYVGLGPADDPDLQMSQYHSTWRYSYVDNPEVDRLIEAGATEMDREKRGAIYRELSALMFEEASVAFLFQNVDLYALAPGVKGFNPRGDQLWTIYGVSVEEN